MPDSNITKHAIAAALKELCREKSFDKISIADITSTCGLNRQTFYYHFEDKYELLNWIYYTEGFARLVDGITLENWDSHIAVLFETMRADKKFYENTVRCTPDTFGNYLFKVVRALFLEAVEALDNGTVPDADKAFFADFYAYGSCGTVRAWVAAGMKTPPEELARRAGSLYPGGPAPVSRAALAGAIARELLALCPAFDCLDEYRARCFVPGHWVTVCAETETYAAKALAIDEEGRLVIQRENGRQEALRCGEVTTRPARTE